VAGVTIFGRPALAAMRLIATSKARALASMLSVEAARPR